MRIIVFITHRADIGHILNHIGVESEPSHITLARGPPLWDDSDAPVDDGVQGEPDWELRRFFAQNPCLTQPQVVESAFIFDGGKLVT